MKRHLIVNADDCNLTPGVTQAILDCHDKGILTSTTFMINLPLEPSTVKSLQRRKNLGVGIHLNVTLGKPVSNPAEIRSLLSGGTFRKVHDQTTKLPKAVELAREYQSQINRFKKAFGYLPTHLDTHHQVHDHPFFLEVLTKVASKNKLPLRRSRLTREAKRTTDFIFGNLTVEGYWRKEALETILENLPNGTSEMMCHPGKNDAALKAISSFTSGREAEYKLFSSPAVKAFTVRQGITLTHFGLCYN
jgi:chitin disaccharide deacetylase